MARWCGRWGCRCVDAGLRPELSSGECASGRVSSGECRVASGRWQVAGGRWRVVGLSFEGLLKKERMRAKKDGVWIEAAASLLQF